VDQAQNLQTSPNPEAQRGEDGNRESQSSLADRAVRGALWTTATSLVTRAIGLVGTLVLTRFLSPDAYGEVSLAAVVIMTAQVLTSCGHSQYVVSKPNAGRPAVFHATFYYLLLGAIAFGLVVLFRGPLGPFVGAPEMGRYIPLMALAGMIERVGTIQDRILVREMRFRSVGLQRSLGELVFTVVTVTLAAMGFGADAIVWGTLARPAVRLVTLSATTPRREWLEPCKITWQHTRDFFAFGLPMSAASIAGFGSRRWDNIVFARLFGQGMAGIYNYAYNLADIPATQIGETIGDVLVPSFAKMDSDERRKRALLRSMQLLILVVAPLAFGLGSIAKTLVETIFDPRWVAIGPMLVVLSVLSVVRPIGWIGSAYLQVRNQPRAIMVLEVTMIVGLLGAVWAFGHMGPLWACAGVGMAFTFNSLSFMWVIRKVDGLSLREQIVPLLPPVIACIPMVAAVFGLRWLMNSAGVHSNWLRLIAETLTGAVVFIPSALVLAPTTSRDFLTLLKNALLKRRNKAATAAAAFD